MLWLTVRPSLVAMFILIQRRYPESKRGLSFECDLKFIISHSLNAGLDIILANRVQVSPVAHFHCRIG